MTEGIRHRFRKPVPKSSKPKSLRPERQRATATILMAGPDDQQPAALGTSQKDDLRSGNRLMPRLPRNPRLLPSELFASFDPFAVVWAMQKVYRSQPSVCDSAEGWAYIPLGHMASTRGWVLQVKGSYVLQYPQGIIDRSMGIARRDRISDSEKLKASGPIALWLRLSCQQCLMVQHA